MHHKLKFCKISSASNIMQKRLRSLEWIARSSLFRHDWLTYKLGRVLSMLFLVWISDLSRFVDLLTRLGLILAISYGKRADRTGRKDVLFLSLLGMSIEGFLVRVICTPRTSYQCLILKANIPDRLESKCVSSVSNIPHPFGADDRRRYTGLHVNALCYNFRFSSGRT